MLLLRNFFRMQHIAVIEIAAAEFSFVRIENFRQFTVKRQTDSIIQIRLGSKVHCADNGTFLTVGTHDRHSAALFVVHIQPSQLSSILYMAGSLLYR